MPEISAQSIAMTPLERKMLMARFVEAALRGGASGDGAWASAVGAMRHYQYYVNEILAKEAKEA